MQLFSVPSQIQGISTLRDKTLKLCVYVSKELSGEEKAKIFDLEQKEGYFVFSPNFIDIQDIPLQEAKVNRKEKSPSQRLYNTIAVFYTQNFPKNDKKLREFYETEIEKYIEEWKGKLI